MKILILSPAHPLRGGIATSSERLAVELQEQGHEVVIYSFSLQYPGFLFPGKSQYTDDPPPPGLCIKTRLNSINPFNWPATGREMAREQADCIIVRFWLPLMGPALGTVLRIARRLSARKPHITALVDNIVPHEKRPGDRVFARYFVRACDDFVVMSHSVGREIIPFFKPAPGVDPLAAGLIRFAPHPIYDTYGPPMEQLEARRLLGLPESARIVLFFGFIRKYKGLDLLLEAAASMPDIHVLVAGECYEDWAPYRQILERQGLEARVHLHTDFIPAQEVARYFGAADLVVQPYRTATQSGISQIAYHFDKPMMVTRVGGLPEIVTDGVSGYVVAPEPAAIAAALRDYFENNRAAAMIAGVRREKERFSWSALVAALLAKC